MTSQTFFSALEGSYASLGSPVSTSASGAGGAGCTWPPDPISRTRDLDLTSCFEHSILLPVPLGLTILFAVAQIISKSRRLKRPAGEKGALRWLERTRGSEKVCKVKISMLACTAILSAASFGLSIPTIKTSPLSSLHYILYTITQLLFIHLTTLNHHTSRQSSTLILLFWPIYFFISVVRVRTMILIGSLSLHLSHHLSGRLLIAREALWLSSVVFGAVDFFLELYTPEKRWYRSKWRAPWLKRGKIALDDSSDEEADTVDQLNGGGMVAGKDEYGDIESPVLTANFYERLSFSWLTPLLSLGTKKYLGEEDMWSLPPNDSAEALSERLNTTWEKQVEMVKQGKKSKPSLKLAIFWAYGGPYFVAGLLKVVYDSLSFLQPQLLRLLLRFVTSYGADVPMPAVAGYAITILMFITSNVATATLHQYFDRCFATTMRVKGGLVTLIYRKSLRLSNGEKAGRATGDIVNLQSVDAVRIGDLAQYGHIGWSGPFQILLAFVSLYNLVGWQAFTGVAVMVISLPINTMMAKYNKKLQNRMMKIKDRRTRLMNEILNNIKSIKLYGWEKAFSEKVLDARNNVELRLLRKIGLVQAGSNFFWSSTPFLVAFATFATFVATSDKPLTSEIIFPAISLFQLLSFPMAVFSNIINSIIEAIVSVKRIEDFLAGEELDPTARELIVDPRGEGPARGEPVVTIKNGEFRWLSGSTQPILQDINLTVNKGELLAVIGRVGDGKSSLLGAMLGEMTRSEGSVKIRGDIAYFSQSAWILSATVKDNIVFGHRFDQEFYDQVIEACALRPDLAVLSQGDMTEVGEKGVSLSGGQKARISLARACYARADIYLLDDPLSAVDAHVGRHIFDKVIGPNGMLRSKARILCTNSVNFLSQTDEVIMLRRGIILERGTYSDAMANNASELYKLITGLGKQSAGEASGSATPTVIGHSSDDENDDLDDVSPQKLMKRQMTVAKLRRASSVSIKQAKRDALRDLRESSKPKEHSEKGVVKRQVYAAYISAASRVGVAVFLIFMMTGQSASILSNFVLRLWAGRNTNAGDNVQVAKYLLAYGLIGISSSFFSVFSQVVLKLYCALRSSRKLHDGSFKALMRSPLAFFEITPTGRILNLFSRDIYVIDEVLVNALSGFLRTCISVLGVIVVIAFGAPFVLIVLVPLAYIYRVIMRYYLSTSRELKRLDAISRSPIFSFFGETLSGLSIIRGFTQTRRFIANNEARIDRNQSCYMPAMTINRWLAVRLEFLGSLLMFSTALVAVSALLISNNVDAGLVGLLMTYTMSITQALNWLVRSASEVEQNIVSVERVLGYASLPSEAADDIPETKPSKLWPAEGGIEFDHYSLRYRPELEPALKDVSFSIKGGERVGVVGRTGAGKSSLTLALFRILEAAGGKISIDGVDISKIGLHDLRNVVSIIPQDPQLFEGTLRHNIDPTNKSKDAEIWQALTQAYLKDHIMDNMGGTLDAEIAEGGQNLSSGQRQLVCFARALLRKTKILVLDEATSSIDLETDEAVQQILRGSDFKGVTTLTIAHRINTIMDSDRVLVMSQGKVAEYDTPEALLQNPDSIFQSMVQEAGLGQGSSASTST